MGSTSSLIIVIKSVQRESCGAIKLTLLKEEVILEVGKQVMRSLKDLCLGLLPVSNPRKYIIRAI